MCYDMTVKDLVGLCRIELVAKQHWAADKVDFSKEYAYISLT
jgi:hypothetical protein